MERRPARTQGGNIMAGSVKPSCPAVGGAFDTCGGRAGAEEEPDASAPVPAPVCGGLAVFSVAAGPWPRIVHRASLLPRESGPVDWKA